MFEELTYEDVKLLIDAVDKWVRADQAASIIAGLTLGAMAGEEDAADVFRQVVAGEAEKADKREEIATLLKAKLIRLRDRLMIQEVGKEIGK